MHEVASGGGRRIALAEESDLVAHRGVAELPDPQAHLHHVRKSERGMELAEGLHGDADHPIAVDVEPAGANQVFVDDGVEVAVIDHVVDVAVDIVVHPARGNGEEVAVILARHDAGASRWSRSSIQCTTGRRVPLSR